MDFHTFFPILLGYVIPWGCILVGAQLGWANIALFREAAAIGRWQKTQGVILRSLIKETEHRSTARHRVRNTTSYAPDIMYDYAVEGHTILGYRLNLHEHESWNVNDIKKLLRQYPLGKKVTVFYNPRNVEQSALSQIVVRQSLAGRLILGIFLLALGIILALWMPGWVIRPS